MSRFSLKRRYTVWTYQAVQSRKGWLINGVIISGSPKVIKRSDSALATFWKILTSYGYQKARFITFELIINAALHLIKTDESGAFNILISDEQIHEIKFREGITKRPLKIKSKYSSHFRESNHSYLVLSDIDDTILVSHSARFLSKLWLMLFHPSPKRKPVEENEKAYAVLRSAGLPFSYVSASEYNLFPLISTFIQVHQIPQGPIYLRPYQYWKDLFAERQRKNYKVETISTLFDHFDGMQVIFFGDDSQHDFDVFTQMVATHSEMVRAIFLRKTGFLKVSEADARTWEIADSDVPIYYYSTFEEIEDPIQQLTHEAARSIKSNSG